MRQLRLSLLLCGSPSRDVHDLDAPQRGVRACTTSKDVEDAAKTGSSHVRGVWLSQHEVTQKRADLPPKIVSKRCPGISVLPPAAMASPLSLSASSGATTGVQHARYVCVLQSPKKVLVYSSMRRLNAVVCSADGIHRHFRTGVSTKKRRNLSTAALWAGRRHTPRHCCSAEHGSTRTLPRWPEATRVCLTPYIGERWCSVPGECSHAPAFLVQVRGVRVAAASTTES